jgi:hypothetical protein
MQKKHLFRLISFFGIIAWLEVFGVKAGFTYAWFILGWMVLVSVLYWFCKQDKDENGDN